MVGCRLCVPLGGLLVDVVFLAHECIIQSIDLDVNDFTIAEDEIQINETVVHPDAVVALSHRIGRNRRLGLFHPVLDHDHFQWVKIRVNADHARSNFLISSLFRKSISVRST